jgi:hypothetical protein
MSDRLPDLLDALLDRQSRAWLADRRPTVEELLDGSALRDDREAQLDLIYNEIVLREDRGESPPSRSTPAATRTCATTWNCTSRSTGRSATTS